MVREMVSIWLLKMNTAYQQCPLFCCCCHYWKEKKKQNQTKKLSSMNWLAQFPALQWSQQFEDAYEPHRMLQSLYPIPSPANISTFWWLKMRLHISWIGYGQPVWEKDFFPLPARIKCWILQPQHEVGTFSPWYPGALPQRAHLPQPAFI